MANVLVATSPGGDESWAQKGFAAQSEVWLQFGLAFPAATKAAWDSDADQISNQLADLVAYINPLVPSFLGGGIYYDKTGVFAGSGSGGWYTTEFFPITALHLETDVWHSVGIHWVSGGDVVVVIDGDTYTVTGGATGGTTNGVRFGSYQFDEDTGTNPVYFRDIKVGTGGFGSTDLFAEDFSGGTLANFDNTNAEVSVTTDPGYPDAGPATTGGILVALSDGILVASPTWTRIDDQTGLHVTAIRINRGRASERDKAQTGTLELDGHDTEGLLDPTCASYLGLDAMQQIAVTLWNPADSTWDMVFRGHLSSLENDLDPSAKWFDFALQAVDMLAILNDAEVAPDQAGNTVPGESAGDVYYTGAHVNDRLLAILADTAVDFSSGAFQPIWPPELLNIFTGNVNVQGRVYANRTTMLQLVDEACDAEFPGVSNRFASKEGIFDFRGRYARYNPDTYIAGSGNAGTARSGIFPSGSQPGLHWYVGDVPTSDTVDDTVAVYQRIKWGWSKENLINAALVTPLGIADADIAGQFYSDATSVARYGPRTSGMSLENLITGDSNDDTLGALGETLAFATGTVENYKDLVTYPTQLVFTNPPVGVSTGRYTSTWRLLTRIELSDLITITSYHPAGGGFRAFDCFVEKIDYEVQPHRGDEWLITLTLGLSPRSYYSVNPFPHS